MTLPFRHEVIADRDAWFARLEDPSSEKATGRLSRSVKENCCLGHGARALDPERKTRWKNVDSGLSPELVERLGMWTADGGTRDRAVLIRGTEFYSLDSLNDHTDMTPQEIGALLRTLREGGEDTPFRPITDFPEG